VDHYTLLGTTRTGRNLPLLGSRGDQHLACCGGGFAQRPPGTDGAATAAGAQANSFEARLHTRLLDDYLLPVGFQFVSQHHGQKRADALSHLGANGPQPDDVVRADADEGVGSKLLRGGFSGQGAGIEMERQR
jgi:hypothetical protein